MLVQVKKSAVWKCDLPTEKLTWTAHTYDLFGIEQQSEIRRRDIIDMYADGCRQRVQAIRSYAIRSKKSFTVDVSIWTSASVKKWLRIDGKLLMSNLTPPRLLGTKQEITTDHLGRLRSRNLIGHDAVTGLPARETFELRYAEIQDQGEYENRSVVFIEVINRRAILEDHGLEALEEGLFVIAGQIDRIVGSQGAAFVSSFGVFVAIIHSAEQSIVAKLLHSLKTHLQDPIFYDGILIFPQIDVQIRNASSTSLDQMSGGQARLLLR